MASRRTRVDVERVRELRAELDAINAVPLDRLDLYEHGKKLKIHDTLLHEWMFTGYCNTDFILMGQYRKRRSRPNEP